MAETAYRFEYISPGIVRGEDWNDFLLYYYEEGRKVSFSGRLPHGDSPGYLDFPSELFWPTKAPEWAKDKRAIIECRLLEYVSASFSLKWVTPSNFAPCPRLRPLPTEAEARKNVAIVVAAQSEYEGTHERIAATRRAVGVVFKIFVAAFVLFVAVKLLLLWR